MSEEDSCKHLSLPEIDQNIEPRKSGDTCEECEIEGTTAVALRLCLTCGHVGCCDSSSVPHARRHYDETKHPLMIALPNRNWKWCYVDNTYL
ncbi:MAG: UBP-type zinc finger domain-containing protein [Nitrososphaerales archaeon]